MNMSHNLYIHIYHIHVKYTSNDLEIRHLSVSEMRTMWHSYGVATVSRIHKITGLFCKRTL